MSERASVVRRRRSWSSGRALLLGACAALGLGGCVTQETQRMDGLLAAAGFQIRPANTPLKMQQLESLTPRAILPIKKDGVPYWIVADPTQCKCLYVGNEAAVLRYEQLKLRGEYANDALMMGEMNESAAMDYGAWGPWGAWGY